MKLCRYIVLFLAIELISSCSQQKKDDQYGTIDSEYFGIEDISRGYDSLQIRIWYMPPMGPLEIPVITIKRTNNEWTGTIRKVYMKVVKDTSRNAMKDDMISVPSKIKSQDLAPKSDWKNVLKKLESFKIFTLPDMTEISGFKDNVLDGESYVIEIAKAGDYRTYSYHVPHHFANKFWQAKNVVDILDLIDTEFGNPWNFTQDDSRLERMGQKFNETTDSVISGKGTQ